MSEVRQSEDGDRSPESALSAVSVSPITMPTSRVSTPAHIDYHLISDHELTLLYKPESTVLGSLGFTALGAAIGFAPAFFNTLDSSNARDGIERTLNAVLFSGSSVAAAICLVIYGIASFRNRGLIQTIRARASTAIN